MTSLPNQDFMSTNRNVLSFLVLDSAKNSNLWLLHLCVYNKTYKRSQAILRLYISLKNQRLTMTVFKRSGRKTYHLERKQVTLWRTSSRSPWYLWWSGWPLWRWGQPLTLTRSKTSSATTLCCTAKHHATAKEGARQNGTGRNHTSLPRNYRVST